MIENNEYNNYSAKDENEGPENEESAETAVTAEHNESVTTEPAAEATDETAAASAAPEAPDESGSKAAPEGLEESEDTSEASDSAAEETQVSTAATETAAAEARKGRKKKSALRAFLCLAAGVVIGLAAAFAVYMFIHGYLYIRFKNGSYIYIPSPSYKLFHDDNDGNVDMRNLEVKLGEIQSLLDKNYYYDRNEKTIEDYMYVGYLYGLTDDNYSEYYPKEEYKETVQQTLKGTYVGIGVTVIMKEDGSGLEAIEVFPEGGAYAAGMRKGDVIVEASGMKISELGMDNAVENYIKGEEGTFVTLKVLRGNEEMEFECERKTLPTVSVRYKALRIYDEDLYADEYAAEGASESTAESASENTSANVSGAEASDGAAAVSDSSDGDAGDADAEETKRRSKAKIGYISVSTFNQTTGDAFVTAVDTLVEEKKVKGLVIDLRGNLGGDMNICLQMLDYLLPDDLDSYDINAEPDHAGDTLLLYIQYREDEKRDYYYAADGHECKLPIVIITDGKSASASEIFTGVMKEYGYKSLGTRTFGKGIVQELYNLRDGSAIKFTIGEYLLPAAYHVHKNGVEPDIMVEPSETLQKVGRSELEPDIRTDNQLNAAVRELLSQLGIE